MEIAVRVKNNFLYFQAIRIFEELWYQFKFSSPLPQRALETFREEFSKLFSIIANDRAEKVREKYTTKLFCWVENFTVC